MRILYNNKIKLSLIAIMFLLGTSCKKLIEVPPNPSGEEDQSSIFSDSLSTMAAIAGVYTYNTDTGIGFAYSDNTLAKYTGLVTDELSTTNTFDPLLLEFYNDALESKNSEIDAVWGYYYKSIYQINAIIIGINSSTKLSATFKRQVIGEMETTRALYYFTLVNLFGGVPVVTTTDYKATSQQPRATADSVYKQITNDLTDAKIKLTENYPSMGHIRPNIYVAEALLAKVYLVQKNWQLAYNAANDVIQSGMYNLENDLNAVFLDGSQEAIWQLPCIVPGTETEDAVDFIPYPGTVPSYPISPYLLQTYDANDNRLADWMGQTQTTDNNGNTVTSYFPYKYKNTQPPFSTTEDFMIFRLGEQYLIRAECEAELGQTTAALKDVNLIRSRAGLGLNPIRFTTQQDLISKILKERQKELFCEWGNRWIDLKRTQTINSVLSVEKPGWKSYETLYPIPFTEIQANRNLDQNPGY